MCGRFISGADELSWKEYCELLRLPTTTEPPLPAEVFPSHSIAAVREGSEGERELVRLPWGLIPSWAKDLEKAKRLINVRGETVHQKFRDHFRNHRCVIPAAGFYEWQKREKGKGKRRFTLRDLERPVISFDGVWGRREDASGGSVLSCAIVTTEASDVVRPIHDRMPVILSDEGIERWLNDEADSGELRELLVPWDGSSFVAEPDEPAEPDEDDRQGSLF